MNDLTNRIEPVATKNFRIKRSNGEIVKGKVDRVQSGRSVNLHVDPIYQSAEGLKHINIRLADGTPLGQTFEAIKDVAFCDAVDGFTMECGDSVTFESDSMRFVTFE